MKIIRETRQPGPYVNGFDSYGCNLVQRVVVEVSPQDAIPLTTSGQQKGNFSTKHTSVQFQKCSNSKQ